MTVIRSTSSPFFLSEIMDKVFKDFFNDSLFTTSIPQPTFQEKFRFQIPSYPVSNFYIEKDGTTVYEIAVTGFDKDEITIETEGKLILITGEKKDKESSSERRYIYKKFSQKDFYLDAPLYDCQNIEKISTSLKNGLLTIRIPLKEENKPIKKLISID